MTRCLLPRSGSLGAPSPGNAQPHVLDALGSEMRVDPADQVPLEKAQLVHPGRALDLDQERAVAEPHGAGVAGELGAHHLRPLAHRAPPQQPLLQAEVAHQSGEDSGDPLHGYPAASGRRSGMIRQSSDSSPSGRAPTGSTTPAEIAVLSRNTTLSVGMLRRMSSR